MKNLTNQGKAFCFAFLSILLYSIPLIVLAIIKSDDLFKTTETALSFFSVVLLLCFIFFAKRVVKSLCKALTPLGFGSIIILLVSLGLKSFLDDLSLIAVASLIGACLSWYPYQIFIIYNKVAYNEDGTVKKSETLTFKEAHNQLFNISIWR